MNLPEIVQRYLAMDMSGVTITPDGLLIPELENGNLPHILVLQHEGGYSLFLHHRLPEHILDVLCRLTPKEVFHDRAMVQGILEPEITVQEIWTGKSHIFPLLRAERVSPEAIRMNELSPALLEAHGFPVDPKTITAFAILCAGQVAASCYSTAENEIGAEAYTFTRSEFRRRGFGSKVTLAWAYDLQQRGTIPFYSHRTDNLASQALANALGLRWFMSDVAYK